MKVNEETLKNEFKSVATNLNKQWLISKDEKLLSVAKRLHLATIAYKDDNFNESLQILVGAKKMLKNKGGRGKT